MIRLMSVGCSAMVLALTFAPGALRAQASWVESFEDNGATPVGQWGPANLMARGWIFRMQSSPASTQAFFDGYHGSGWPTAQSGYGYLVADAFMDRAQSGPVSHWAILPVVPAQVAGDLVRVWLRRVGGLPANLEVRYSPSGGIDTGAGVDAVGDFTDLLVAATPIPANGWLAYSAPVPGGGRLALRFTGRFEAFGSGLYSGIDTLSVGPPPPPPCNLPPAPVPGETVTWTLAGSPYRICSDLVIPPGGSAVVEPGVVVEVDEGKSVVVDGRLTAHGTATQPITFRGGISTVHPPLWVPYGTLDVAHGVVGCRIHGGKGAEILVADTTFVGQGILSSIGPHTFPSEDYAYLQVDRSSFGPGGIYAWDATLVVRDSTFANGSLGLVRGGLWVSDVSLDAGILAWERERPGQSALVDGVSVRNNPTLPAMRLNGGNYLVGPHTTIEGNLYPLQLGGGLLAGTTLPLVGNTHNYIYALAATGGKLEWARHQLPYVVGGVAGTGFGTQLRIEPGTVVRFEPGAGWSYGGGARLLAEGLPEAPITFEAHVPGQPWVGISFNSNGTMPRLENCIVRGARAGIVASDSPNVWLQDCVLEDNETAAQAAVFGWLRVRKSRFFSNDIALKTDFYPVSHGTLDLFGGTNPNWFEGNGVAVQIGNPYSTIPAEHDYWGSPTGPRHPDNPGGTGDLVDTGGSLVDVIPFRTTPPNVDDHPPIVRMMEPSRRQRAREKLILEWTARDDGGIVAQRVLFTPHGNNPDFTVIAELPPDQRAYELTIPVIEPSSNDEAPFVRILAVDTAGQEGWDEVSFGVPYTEDWSGTLTITSDFSAGLRPGQRVDVCYTHSGQTGTVGGTLFLEGDDSSIALGGGTTASDCLPGGLLVPYVSTDRARVGVTLTGGAGGRVETFYSDFFAIRPDPRVGDAPPAVEVTAPGPGSAFPGGGVVPIAWTASDDQAVRSFSIQASYDNGRSWSFIARDLPGTAESYLWWLPPSTGIPDVRLRVLAVDLHFQNTSDGTAIAIAPGGGGSPADIGLPFDDGFETGDDSGWE